VLSRESRRPGWRRRADITTLDDTHSPWTCSHQPTTLRGCLEPSLPLTPRLAARSAPYATNRTSRKKTSLTAAALTARTRVALNEASATSDSQTSCASPKHSTFAPQNSLPQWNANRAPSAEARLATRGGPPDPRHMTRPIEARQGNCPPEKIERVSTKPPRSILHSTGLRRVSRRKPTETAFADYSDAALPRRFMIGLCM